jgi:hypothetical protein
MKKTTRFLLFILALASLVLSACGGVSTATPSTGGGRPQPMVVAFTGVVESIAGDQWVINGQTVTVAPGVIRDGPFIVGDHVKVEGAVNPDGSFTVSRVETPSPEDLSTLPQFGNDNSDNDNANDANSNDVNSNDDNSNDANVNDDNSNDDNDNSANVNDDNGDNNDSDDSSVNDDNGTDDNSNDVNSNDANSNDDADSNDDNSGGGNDNGGNDDGGGNDNGGGGDDNGENSNGG